MNKLRFKRFPRKTKTTAAEALRMRAERSGTGSAGVVFVTDGNAAHLITGSRRAA